MTNKHIRTWHRRLALVLGLCIVFQGVSGAVAQYRWWLLQATEPASYRTDPDGAMATPGQVLSAIERDRPGFNTAHVMYPAASAPDAAVIAMGGRSKAAHDMSLIVTVDPYRGQAIDEVSARAGWVGTVTTLHRWVIFGTTGRIILTLVGLGMMATSLMGLVLWWRTRTSDRHATGIVRLHRLTGAALGLLVLSVSTTGTALNLFTWYEKSANTSVTSSNMAAASHEHSGHIHPSIDTDAAFRTALAAVGQQRLAAFSPAGPHARHYWFAFNDDQLKRTDVLVDASSGKIVGVYPAGVLTGGKGLRQWLFPIHSGYVIGPVGGALMTLVGLTTVGWLVSGIVIWRSARRPRRQGI